MMATTKADDLLIAHEMVSRYWAVVDGIADVTIERCFTEDCIMKIDALKISGRAMLTDAIHAKVAKAAEQGRSTRHLTSNLRVRTQSEAALVLDGLLTVFSGYGDKPAPLGLPSSIGDFSYHFMKVDGEAWRISRLEGVIVFAGQDSPFAKKAAAPVSA